MSDEKFEEFLQRESKSYNEPPALVPRDEMWAAVSKAREVRDARPGAGAVITALHPKRGAGGIRRHASWIGMAATLLVGVGIGRFALQREAGPLTPADVTTASAPLDAATGDTAERRVPALPDPTVVPMAREVAVAPAGTRSPTVRNAGAVPMLEARRTPANGAYGVVSQRHLASAEALITVVTATPRDAMMDSLTTRWAREMLSSTRLLLDSPAGDEPLRRRLLEDLETLLVQLVQRSGGAVDERDLIDRTLQRTQLLTRLRTNAAGT